MMRLNRYFDLFVVPNYRKYVESESDISAASGNFDPEKREAANRWALAAAMNVAIPAYHMTDAMLNETNDVKPEWARGLKIRALRPAIEERYCLLMRTEQQIDDLTLLGAIADAYKHSDLDNKDRPVTSNRATIVIATGYDELGFGEGKFGGTDQVIVRTTSGTSRAFSSVIRNVVDMWARVLGRPLEPLG